MSPQPTHSVWKIAWKAEGFLWKCLGLCGSDEAAVHMMLGIVLASAELGVFSGSSPMGELSEEVGSLQHAFRA